MSRHEILSHFSPRWFIALMGTGAVALIMQGLDHGNAGALHVASVTLLLLILVAFPIFLLMIASRFIVNRALILRELEHSGLVQFYAAIAISAAICVAGLVKIPLGFIDREIVLSVAKIYWFISLTVGIFLAIFIPWRIITLDHGEPKRVLGFWFLPPVGLFVLIFAGNFLSLALGDPAWISNIFVLNTLLLGVASVQTVIIFTIFLFRAMTFPFPSPDVIPSFTIGLAPVGVSIVAFLSYIPLLAKASPAGFVSAAAIVPFVKFAMVLIWGFGLWWFIVALCVVITAFKRHGVPFTLGYWAFVFPTAAFTISSLVLGKSTGFVFIQTSGMVLGYTLIFGWCLTLILTIRGIYNHSIFRLPASFAEILKTSDYSKDS